MDLTKHCELCDHQAKRLKFGTTCGLTERKPEFNKMCTKIELNDKFEEKLKSININYEKVKPALSNRKSITALIAFTYYRKLRF